MSLIDLTITPREKDLGGFSVRRVLPYAKRRMVGPFIFLDHMGPADFAAGQGMDVRPHPHIGLSTVTYLFEGEMFHRDSIGSAQEILPGAGSCNRLNTSAGLFPFRVLYLAYSRHMSVRKQGFVIRAYFKNLIAVFRGLQPPQGIRYGLKPFVSKHSPT
jgi:hypothetical protein